MKKTRNQRKREREELMLLTAIAVWIIVGTALVLYKAVTG